MCTHFPYKPFWAFSLIVLSTSKNRGLFPHFSGRFPKYLAVLCKIASQMKIIAATKIRNAEVYMIYHDWILNVCLIFNMSVMNVPS